MELNGSQMAVKLVQDEHSLEKKKEDGFIVNSKLF